MLNIYKNCSKFNYDEFKEKKLKINKADWSINTDYGYKNLQNYQYQLLQELYTIFNVGNEKTFKGYNQSGAIYGNWKLNNPKLNNMNQKCNIFMMYSDILNEYEFYHINLKTYKIRKIIKKEFNITKKSLRYKPY